MPGRKAKGQPGALPPLAAWLPKGWIFRTAVTRGLGESLNSKR